MTSTNHRPRCTRPGWTVEPSTAIHGISIVRCTGCDAVELRAADAPMDRPAVEGSHGRPTVEEAPASRRRSA